jgi:hypothetical protein
VEERYTKAGLIERFGAGYRRARLSALAGSGAFGTGFGFGAAAGSSFASAERSGSRRGA